MLYDMTFNKKTFKLSGKNDKEFTKLLTEISRKGRNKYQKEKHVKELRK